MKIGLLINPKRFLRWRSGRTQTFGEAPVCVFEENYGVLFRNRARWHLLPGSRAGLRRSRERRPDGRASPCSAYSLPTKRTYSGKCLQHGLMRVGQPRDVPYERSSAAQPSRSTRTSERISSGGETKRSHWRAGIRIQKNLSKRFCHIWQQVDIMILSSHSCSKQLLSSSTSTTERCLR